MRLSPHRSLAFMTALALAALAAAQPPPPPYGGANQPPPKQNPPPGEDRRNPNRPRAAAGQLPVMSAADMPELAPATEEPVTSSGNVDLWRARIAERRARQEQAASGAAAPR